MITFNLSEMNAVQLAKLYKFLVATWRQEEAELVYEAGIANCGAGESLAVSFFALREHN